MQRATAFVRLASQRRQGGCLQAAFERLLQVALSHIPFVGYSLEDGAITMSHLSVHQLAIVPRLLLSYSTLTELTTSENLSA